MRILIELSAPKDNINGETLTMSKSIYEKIGFSECPFMEAGAATNVTPYIPEKLSRLFEALTECAAGGQFAPLILGGAAGAGKTTITKYYFYIKMHERFKEDVSKSLSIFYTITDANELRDIALFYRRLIGEVLNKAQEKSADVYGEVSKECNVPSRLQSEDSREMLDLFEDVNRSLRKRYAPLIYVIDEIDYVADLINEKNYTFTQHLRHMIDFFCELRYVVLILASTKLPASHIRTKLRIALGPLADRVAENVELDYTEEDFLKFVETRFTEPVIEGAEGGFSKRDIHLEIRDPLEKDYGKYFPFTEHVLRHLYRRERGPKGVTLERLRILERTLAQLINIYCSEAYAATKGMTADKIFTKDDVDKFLTVQPVAPDRLVDLLPKEEEWFDRFFGFRSDQYEKFAHEKCVSAITLSLSKYLEAKFSAPGSLPFQEHSVKSYVTETRKGLKFLVHCFNLNRKNMGWAITLLRHREIDLFGWDSLNEVVEALYSKKPLAQKKIILVCVEDDFEFSEVADRLVDLLREKEKDKCIRSEDIQNIEIVSDPLMIRSANSFRLLFVKHSNLVDIISIIAKLSTDEVIKIGNKFFQPIYDAIDGWISNPVDFFRYSPSMNRILQSAILYAGVHGKFPVTDKKLNTFFKKSKHRGDRYLFDYIRLNGFLREVRLKTYRISIPPTLVYLFKTHKQLASNEIKSEFGDPLGEEICEFLEGVLGLRVNGDELTLKIKPLKEISESTKDLIVSNKEISEKQNLETYISLIDKLTKLDYKRLDQELGLDAHPDFIFSQVVASRFVAATKSFVEAEIRRARSKRRTTQQELEPSDEDLADELLEEEKVAEKDLLETLIKPKTIDELRKEYTKEELTDDMLWTLLRRLRESGKISMLVSSENLDQSRS